MLNSTKESANKSALFKLNALIYTTYSIFIEVKIPKFRRVSKVKANLVKYKKKFVRLIRTYYYHYNRQAFFIYKGKKIRFPVNGQIIVNAAFFRKINPNYARLKPLPKRVRSTSLKPTNLTKDNLLIYSPTIPRFSLNIAKFLKDIIIALTKARTNLANGFKFNNFITRKGRGLVILLHSLGLGKTLTAKTIAKHLKQPLYLISAGKLSTKIANKADIYFKRRLSYNLSYNSLVTIFLRKLEYLKGILFLTINYISEFNEAILSQVYLILKYNKLSSDARKQI
ncbi:P-loop containing nucleoside triphosphate hydrolase protein [Cenococcum geophilum]